MAKRAVVLGGGLIGSVIAQDLRDGLEVTLVDRDAARLEAVAAKAGDAIHTRAADLSDPGDVKAAIAEADVVVGALPSGFAFGTLKTVLEAGKPYADISFMVEDAWDLDGLAKERGATAVVDCGVAPGMTNVFAGRAAHALEPCERIAIYVGGLPRERRLPFEYKAGFAPADVIEEYTRPSRVVEGGEVVVKPALTEPELLEFPGVGTLEAFLTDGLRSLVVRLPNVTHMFEKTMRYPGHRELMLAFRDAGLFGTEPVDVGGARVRPVDVATALLVPRWTFAEGEADLVCMRVVADGVRDGRPTRLVWELHDDFDPATGWTAMARTTAFPCAITARLLAEGAIEGAGVLTPEQLGQREGILERYLAELERRGVKYRSREETPA